MSAAFVWEIFSPVLSVHKRCDLLSGNTGIDYGGLIKINHITGKILGWRMTQLLEILIT